MQKSSLVDCLSLQRFIRSSAETCRNQTVRQGIPHVIVDAVENAQYPIRTIVQNAIQPERQLPAFLDLACVLWTDCRDEVRKCDPHFQEVQLSKVFERAAWEK